MVDTVVDGIITFDTEGVIDSFNPAATVQFGYTQEEAIGQNITRLVPELAGADGKLTTRLDDGDPLIGATIEKLARRKDGEPFPVELSTSEMQIASQRLFTCVARDITDRKKAEETIRLLALNDPLTGLANRNLFHRRLEDAIRLARRHNQMAAVMFLDLDGFKAINDTFGHPTGDRLLTLTGERLLECCRAVDTVARLGGVEFAVVLVDVKDPA